MTDLARVHLRIVASDSLDFYVIEVSIIDPDGKSLGTMHGDRQYTTRDDAKADRFAMAATMRYGQIVLDDMDT